MMKRTNHRLTYLRLGAVAALSLGGLVAIPLFAQEPSLRMLDRIDPGLWEVRVRDAAHTVRRLCLESGRPLIQIKHPNTLCRSFVVEDESRAVTVHYTCPGAGYGRTRIRLENPQLTQIDSQGIADSYPFDFTAEARRVGTCHE